MSFERQHKGTQNKADISKDKGNKNNLRGTWSDSHVGGAWHL